MSNRARALVALINRVGTLVVFVLALTGCSESGYELNDDDLGTPNRTLVPIIPKAAMFPRLQDISVSTLSPVQPKDISVSTLSPVQPKDISVSTLSPVQPKDISVSTLSPVQPKDISLSTLFPVQPKVVGPLCISGATVDVPAGGSVTFTSPTPPTKALKATNKLCGWDFKTVTGSNFALTCQSFNLSGQNALYVNEYRSSRPLVYRFSSQSFPSRLLLNAVTVRVLFLYDPSGSQGYFSCTITASGGTTASTTTSAATSTTTSSTTSTTTSAMIKAVVPCRCGIVNRTVRIVGGTNTQVNEYPWQVGLMYTTSRSVFCGGTLINDRYILTAAHCMKGRTISSFRVLLSGHTKDSSSATEKIVKPLSITTHPKYNVGVAEDNDISLIKISPLVFSSTTVKARPVCLPNSADLYAGVMATTTGWGTLSVGGVQPNILQEVNIPIVTNAYCASVYGNASITKNMICAGTAKGGTDSCQGDSGGPLIAPDGANYELIGVVSFGSGCGDPGVPGVYARVSTLQPWIVSKVAGSTTCGR